MTRFRFCLLILTALPVFGLEAKAEASLLVKNARLITMHPGQPDSFVGWFTVGPDGRIAALAAGDAPASVAASADHILDAAGKIVGPGFISTHSHLFMSPLRGLGHTETLFGWLQACGRYYRTAPADDMYWFTLHGSLDFLRNGITTAYDFTYSAWNGSLAAAAGPGRLPATADLDPYEVAALQAKADAGLRFVNSVSVPVTESPDTARRRVAVILDWAHAHFGSNPLLLRMALSGWAQYSTREAARLEAELMHEHGLLCQAHFLESPDGVPEQQTHFDWYEEAGALGPDFIFGHFIQTTPDIVRRAAAAGASVSWQPTSNSRLASGVADIPLYEAMGLKIGVGLDDQSCTDISDPFQNLRIGMALIRTKYKDAKAMSVQHMLYLHTLGSAEILGVADKIGSLAPGKYADFLLVDPRDPDTGPIHDVLGTYVLACGLRNLKQVYVGGRLVVDGTKLMTYDETRLRPEIDTRIDRLRAAAESADLKAAAAQTHDSAKAIELYTAALAMYPKDGDTLIDRGFAHWGAGQTHLAAADFQKAVELMPDSPRALIARGDLNHRFLARDFAACERDYARAHELDPDFPGFHAYTAELYLYTGEPEKTLAEAKKGLAREPVDLIHKLNLAHALLFTGHPQEAKALYAELAPLEIAHGRKGAAFALRDFETLAEKGTVKYPQMATLKPWLESQL